MCWETVLTITRKRENLFSLFKQMPNHQIDTLSSCQAPICWGNSKSAVTLTAYVFFNVFFSILNAKALLPLKPLWIISSFPITNFNIFYLNCMWSTNTKWQNCEMKGKMILLNYFKSVACICVQHPLVLHRKK